MNPLKVLILGAAPLDLPANDRIMWIVKGANEGPNESENYLMTKKMVRSVDFLVVNFQDRNLNFSDGVIMEMAYSTSTPIFMVAQAYRVEEFVDILKTTQFISMDSLIDHLQAHYF